MKTKHTPGPWTFDFNEYGGYDCMTAAYSVRASGTLSRLVAVECPSHEPDDKAEANARLIAAAPDLLDLLKLLILRLDLEPVKAVFPCSAMRDDIRAAIAKAEEDRYKFT